MSLISFSICPTCDCESFDFFDTTGRAPGRPDGYPESADLSQYSGTLTWADVSGNIVGTYDIVPREDATEYMNIRYDKDPANTIKDGAYSVTYEVRDGSGDLVGSATQPVVITCQIECEVEKMVDNYTSSAGHGKQVLLEKVNEIMNRIRMASWLAQAGYTENANTEIKIAHDYV